MQTLVVVESVFGNTRAIADAVAGGLAHRGDVRVLTVTDAAAATGLLDGVDLLVVGGPTHVFGMTRAATRRSAAEEAGGGAVAATTGLREWLADLPATRTGLPAAVFDTRTDHPRLPGSAASGVARRLRRLGYELVARPESFRVTGTAGPLLADEAERARIWGHNLLARVTLRAAEHSPG